MGVTPRPAFRILRLGSKSNPTMRPDLSSIVLTGIYPWANSTFDRLLPRPLMPVAHRPLISFALSWLRQGGIDRVAVCANRETRALQTRLLPHVPPGMRLSYFEDPMPRGAAGSARDAASADEAGTFVVADGSAIPTVDLKELVLNHRASGAAATVVVHSESRGSGNPGLQVPAGIYVFERRALEAVPTRGFFDIKEHLIPRLRRSGEKVRTFSTRGAIPRVMSAQTYLAVCDFVVDHLVAADEVPDGYTRVGDSLVHHQAFVAHDAAVVGPVLIGPGAQIMSGATVIGPTSLGRDVTISSGALVSRSAVWRRSTIAERSVADRCILADDTVLEADQRAFRSVIAGNRSREYTVPAVTQPVGVPTPAPAFRLSSGTNRWLTSPPWARMWRRDAGLASISRF